MKKNLLTVLGLILSINLVFASCGNDKDKTSDSKSKATVEQKTTVAQNVTTTPSTQDQDPWKKISPTKVNQLTTEGFKQLIFDYTQSQTWQYKGDKPCVIDFYADWCRPCKYVAPIMEELAKEYQGKVIFFRVNVDQERELAQVFGIQSIPSILFCPVTGMPQMAVGAMQKENYIKAITEITKVQYPKK